MPDRAYCVCGFPLDRVDDCTLAMLGFCSESCLVRGEPDPMDERNAPVDDDDFTPHGSGGNLDG